MIRPAIIFRRAYHAVQHTNPEHITNITHDILNIALNKYVPIYGFKEISILNAAKDLNYTSPSILGCFQAENYKTPVDALVFHNLSSKRLALSQYYDESFNEDKAIMMKNLFKKRLEMNQPIKTQLTQALSNMILPHNFQASISELSQLADEFQFLCNDRSTDFSWYTKRFSVAAIYVQSELHMLETDNFDKTVRFMETKIDEMNKLGDVYNNVEEWSIFNLISLVNLIKSQLARG